MPAIFLAGAGLYLLRQDQLLARHGANEHARLLAEDLVAAVPGLLDQELPNHERVSLASRKSEEDPVLRLGDRQRIACWLTLENSLAYPPAIAPLPAPVPLDVSALSGEQRVDWEIATRALFNQNETTLGIEALERFLSRAAPAQFMGLARFRLGTFYTRMGRFGEGRSMMESVIQAFPDVKGESGLPLQTFAVLRLAELSASSSAVDVPSREWFQAVSASAVLEPTPLSRMLLMKTAAIERRSALSWAGADWFQVWTAHESARRFYERWRHEVLDHGDRNSVSWIQLEEGRNYLAWMTREEGGFQLIGISDGALRDEIGMALRARSIPEYFEVNVRFAGRNVIGQDRTDIGPLLATASGSKAPAAAMGIEVDVVLSRPELLYAAQRKRTIWFGALIGSAAVAVVIGFVSAWRAFRRQQHLGEMKTNFVSSVSHELRAPIASVRLMAEELHDAGLQDGGKQKEYHRFIVQECRRLSGLIENVLDFARHEQGRKEYEFESTDVVTLVRATSELMRAYAGERSITIATVIRGEAEPIVADGRALQQVLVNLIDNAIKHSPTGCEIEVGIEFESGRIRLWVRDFGEGIPESDRRRIFERFYRRGSELRRETQGVGLGLAIVKAVVEAHRGTVTVRSVVGDGSCFVVELPGGEGKGKREKGEW